MLNRSCFFTYVFFHFDRLFSAFSLQIDYRYKQASFQFDNSYSWMKKWWKCTLLFWDPEPRSVRGRPLRDCRACSVVKMRNHRNSTKEQNNDKISLISARKKFTWKAHNVLNEMEGWNIRMMGIGEVKWSGNGNREIDEYHLYYNYFQKILLPNVLSVSERIILMQISTSSVPSNTNQTFTNM